MFDAGGVGRTVTVVGTGRTVTVVRVLRDPGGDSGGRIVVGGGPLT